MEPKAFVDAGFREIVSVISSEEILKAHGVADAKDREIETGRIATLLRIDPFRTRTVCETQRGIDRGKFLLPIASQRRRTSAIEGLIEKCGRRLVHLVAKLHFEAQVVLPLPIKGQCPAVEVHHVVHFRPFEGGENVVLICGQEFI